MSYLALANGIPNFSKAVISLWFRVPKVSAIAASTSKLPAGIDNYFMMQSILPLVTFGAPQQSKLYDTPNHNVAVIHPYIPGEPGAGITYMTRFYQEQMPYDVEPSYIGLACSPFEEEGKFRLEIHLQMQDRMSLAATDFITTKMDIWSGSDPAAPVNQVAVRGSGVIPLAPNVGVATIADSSYVDIKQPEFFTVTSSKILKPDQWHHLLLSFDIGGSVSIGTPFASSGCRLWYAIDDEDYRGAENMQPYRDTGGQWGPDTLDPNAILTRTAWAFSGRDPNWTDIHYYQNHYVGLPSGSYAGGLIPSAGAAIGIPSSAKYVEGIFRCEMAEFQMWTGVTLDTGVLANRRAFVDSDGKPVNPTNGTEDDPRAPAEKLLGKKPEIMLHGNSNWQAGYNTGTLGIEVDTEGDVTKLPSGQFTRVAKIEKYKPEPSLEETPTA